MLDSLLNQIKNAIFNSPSTPHSPTHDPDGLISQITGLFGQHQNAQQSQFPNVRPASEDPLGDPADAYGAGQGGYRGGMQTQFPNLRPASEDPLGDPADQEPRRY